MDSGLNGSGSKVATTGGDAEVPSPSAVIKGVGEQDFVKRKLRLIALMIAWRIIRLRVN